MNDSVWIKNGFGYSAGGKLRMIRCFECGRENWAPAVASGQCAWCGYDANGGSNDKKETTEKTASDKTTAKKRKPKKKQHGDEPKKTSTRTS